MDYFTNNNSNDPNNNCRLSLKLLFDTKVYVLKFTYNKKHLIYTAK